MPAKYSIIFPRNYGAYIEVEDPAITKKITGASSEFSFQSPIVFGEAPVSKAALKSETITPGKEIESFRDRPQDLILWLPFYEGEGNKLGDLSIYKRHATIYGSVWERLPGRGWALKHDGIDDYIATSRIEDLSVKKTFSIEMWIYVFDTEPRSVPFCVHLTDFDRCGFSVQYDLLRFGYYDGEWTGVGGKISAKQWFYIVGIKDSSLHLFVNNVEVTVSVTPYFSGMVDYTLIGRDYTTFFGGYISITRAWSRPLTAEERTKHFEEERVFFGV